MNRWNPAAVAVIGVLVVCFTIVAVGAHRLANEDAKLKIALLIDKQQIKTNKRAIAEAHLALCAIKTSDQFQVTRTKEFLRQHPGGIPGISAKELGVTITALEVQLRNFKGVKCS